MLQMKTARPGARLSHSFVAALLLACGAVEEPPANPAAADSARQAAPPTPIGAPPLARLGSILAPPRTQDDGSPDACELLGAADPAALLGAEVAAAQRVYGLCWVETAVRETAERSVGLEIRRDPNGVPANLEQFWEREGGGVQMLGSSREQIELLPLLGDYALWFPVEGGMQLFSYWKNQYILVLTVRGVPTERALPWARALAAASLQRAS